MAEIRWTELCFILKLLFQLAGADPEYVYVYHSVGQTVSLSCTNRLSSPGCSTTKWIHDRVNADIRMDGIEVVTGGAVVQPRGDRLSLGSDCSLLLSDVRAEDAGVYGCYQYRSDTGAPTGTPSFVPLSLLTISSIPSGPGLKPGGPGNLTCSLLGHRSCGNGLNLTWLDDDGVQVKDSHICSSCPCETSLRLQEEQKNRRFRCQLSVRGAVKTYADFPPSSTDLYIFIGRAVSVATGLLLLTAAVIFTHRKRRSGNQTPTDQTAVTGGSGVGLTEEQPGPSANQDKARAGDDDDDYDDIRSYANVTAPSVSNMDSAGPSHL